jgi:putative cardiolipin synthase
LGACTSQPVEPFVRPAPEYALPARAGTAFAGLEATIRNGHGPDASGFALLDSNEDGLRWRLALIDSARHTIDVQYYLWYGDVSGRLLMKRVLDAADRGVRVRMLVDDLNTVISDASGKVQVRDEVAAWLDAHPNLELRVFNPWRDRTLAGRVGESVSEMGRVNQRMHNKALVVDNQAVILGGRNIGDEYLGLNPEFNFHDLDVVGIGPVARQTSVVFDLFWNSEWVMPASAFGLPTPADGAAARERLFRELEATTALQKIPVPPGSWSAELAALTGRLRIGTSNVATDRPEPGTIRQDMLGVINALVESTTRELHVINAYIIPDDPVIERLRRLQGNGVTMTIVTNSLASHDVPAVNSHYKKWRKPLLDAGVQLHEMRHDAAIQAEIADTAPTRAKFMGLHAKGMVVDRERVWIGSMNFDPRSAGINTEMGVTIECKSLAEDLARLIERDALPANSWRVQLDPDGRLTWTNDQQTVTRQPARSFRQRVEDVLFMAFPKELY